MKNFNFILILALSILIFGNFSSAINRLKWKRAVCTDITQKNCGGTCCGPAESCCGSTLCCGPADSCCGGTLCCGPADSCCGGTLCCGPIETCCGSTCCSLFQTCSTGNICQ
ncbi:hypothetical protein RhiirC2_487127 [Rhizophagus irregularis]|uniref:Uncharacterized protein n=1 Tax=Rhizophagus irregularis TaxID=588596 RepID=A0A2N1N7J6_9GLOM|nr:hypothetical protein RhiirC2_487127 [Rhizophagus irregularis]